MSYLDNPDGSPQLEHHDELVLQWFHNSPQARQIILGSTALSEEQRPVRRLADRNASISDIYEIMDRCIAQFQMHFIPSNKNPWLLNFPFMFITPEAGDRLRNLKTNETYTVKYVPLTANREFQGTVLLETGAVAPLTGERLVYENPTGVGEAKRRLIQFFHYQPMKAAKDISATDGDTGNTQAEKFTSSIVAQMRRQEPGTIGKRPFDIAKEIKPRIREIYAHPLDPVNYSIQVRGQWMDNILRFTCYDTSYRKAEKLVNWFTDFMHKYIWVLKKNGVQEILYWQRRVDENVEKWRDDIVGYPLEWFFRTEELHVNVIHNIRSIDTTISKSTDLVPQVETGVDFAGGIVLGPFGQRFSNLFDALHDDSGNYLYGDFSIDQSS